MEDLIAQINTAIQNGSDPESVAYPLAKLMMSSRCVDDCNEFFKKAIQANNIPVVKFFAENYQHGIMDAYKRATEIDDLEMASYLFGELMMVDFFAVYPENNFPRERIISHFAIYLKTRSERTLSSIKNYTD